MTPPRAFIIDVDNTLIDTEKIKSLWKNRFKTKLADAYEKSKHADGYLDTKSLAKLLSVDVSYFHNTPFKKYLFKDSTENLMKLKKIGKVLIFSVGDTIYQPLKIKESGIEKTVGAKNVYIVRDKKTGLKRLATKLKKAKITDIAMVDDIASNFEKVMKVYPGMINVWLRYGKYKNKYPTIKNIISFEAGNFTEATEYLSRLVGVVKPTKTILKLSILRGIDNTQIKQLIAVTKVDRAISKFTHDTDRFKSVKSFKAWQRRKKYIYVLTDKAGKLKGILWFSEKTYKTNSYTVGIRIYKPLRGKGLSKKFMKMAMDDFSIVKKRGLWLSVNTNNLPAINLYKSIGFKIAEKKSLEDIMVFKNS